MNSIKILFFGDIYGKPGRKSLMTFLPSFKENNEIDLCIANCENIADGRGITEKGISEMLKAGVDIFSSGNHLWDRKESIEYISRESRIAKPLNYPKDSVGFESVKVEIKGVQLLLVSLCGQGFMKPVDSPFFALESFLHNLRTPPLAHLVKKDSVDLPKCVIVDFHAESTAEKRTLGYYFDGKISAMLGTHTHVQTSDEEIFSQGTAYITDVGMCGAHKSVIGNSLESSFEAIKTSMPVRHETAQEGIQINAVLFEIDPLSRKATSIKRIREYL